MPQCKESKRLDGAFPERITLTETRGVYTRARPDAPPLQGGDKTSSSCLRPGLWLNRNAAGSQ